MSVEEIERLLRVGMCSPGRHAETGCATCTRIEEAIAFVRALALPADPPTPPTERELALTADRDAWIERAQAWNRAACEASLALVTAEPRYSRADVERVAEACWKAGFADAEGFHDPDTCDGCQLCDERGEWSSDGWDARVPAMHAILDRVLGAPSPKRAPGESMPRVAPEASAEDDAGDAICGTTATGGDICVRPHGHDGPHSVMRYVDPARAARAEAVLAACERLTSEIRGVSVDVNGCIDNADGPGRPWGGYICSEGPDGFALYEKRADNCATLEEALIALGGGRE